jgi:archaellum biogenesis protein FlaJ (TadC family)
MYYKGFKKLIISIKYCYLFLAFFYLDLVKHINNIKLNIKLSYTKLKKRFLKKKKKITVLDCDYI